MIVAALGPPMCGCLDQSQLPRAKTAARAKADEAFGKEAVEAAAAGDYVNADALLSKIVSDSLCDDYSEAAALKLLELGKTGEAAAIAYKIDGATRRDRLLTTI